MITVVLENERPMSMNKYWAGMHWTKRKKEADRVHQLVQSSLPSDSKMFDVPVFVAVHVFFKNRPLDADNIVPKPYIDGLRGHLLKDDDIGHIKGVVMYPYVDKSRPRIEIEITPVIVD